MTWDRRVIGRKIKKWQISTILCQEWKAKKTTIMNEHKIQHTNSTAQDANMFSQQDLNTTRTQGRQGAISPGDVPMLVQIQT